MTTEFPSADDAARRDGSRLSEGLGAGSEARCWCHTCRQARMYPTEDMRMVLCPDCGNKRCPKASDHTLNCTNSNAHGQPGSVYGGLCDWPNCDCNKESPQVVDGSQCWRGMPRKPRSA